MVNVKSGRIRNADFGPTTCIIIILCKLDYSIIIIIIIN